MICSDALMLTQGVYALTKDENDYPKIDFYSERFVESFEKSYALLWDNPGCYMSTEQPYYTYIKRFSQGQGLFSPMFIQYLFEGDMRDMKDEYGVIEALSAYSYKYLRPAIYEVSLSAKGVRDEKSVEMLDLVLDSRKYDFVSALQYDGKFQFTQDKTYRNLLSNKNKDIASYYETNKASAQTYIENLVETLEENE